MPADGVDGTAREVSMCAGKVIKNWVKCLYREVCRCACPGRLSNLALARTQIKGFVRFFPVFVVMIPQALKVAQPQRFVIYAEGGEAKIALKGQTFT